MIRSYASKLGNSRPIYKLSLNDSKSRINSRLVNKYSPRPDLLDPISTLVCYHFMERLVGDKYIKDYEGIEKAVIMGIKNEFKKFIVCYGGFKNARQSGIHRFLNTYATPPPEVVDGLVYLYRYARLHGMSGGTMIGAFTDTDQKHIDNILAILELMRSKFEPKS